MECCSFCCVTSDSFFSVVSAQPMFNLFCLFPKQEMSEPNEIQWYYKYSMDSVPLFFFFLNFKRAQLLTDAQRRICCSTYCKADVLFF